MSELGYSYASAKGYVSYIIANGDYFNGSNGNTHPAFRHLKKKNVLFLDGHVSTIFQGNMSYYNYLE